MNILEAVTRRYSVKKVFLKISQISQKNACARVSFLIIKFQACNFIKKETLAQAFSCEFCEIFKGTFFYRTPPVATSVFYSQYYKILNTFLSSGSFKDLAVLKISCLCLKSSRKLTDQTISMTDSLSEKILSCRNALQRECYYDKIIKQNNKTLCNLRT